MTYTHTLTDTNYNTQNFQYEYTFVDSNNQVATPVTKTITPTSYANPAVSLTVVAASGTTSPETNASREVGNTVSTITGTITNNNNSTYVPLSAYILQYNVNGGGTWTSLTSAISVGPGTSSIISFTHNNPTLSASTSIGYRVLVYDSYQNYISSQYTSGTNTVNFYDLVWYGPTSVFPVNTANIRALPNRSFTSGLANPFSLVTGTTYDTFTVAFPSPHTITQVLDTGNLNANITSNYVLSAWSVNSYNLVPTSYNVYTLSNATPYSPSTTHSITWS